LDPKKDIHQFSGIIECGPCPGVAFFSVGAECVGADDFDGDCAVAGNPNNCTPVTL
jgi:hypothetical protein